MIELFKRLLKNPSPGSCEPRRQVLRAADDVKISAHPEGVVLVHIGRGAIFTANRVGAAIWNAIVHDQDLDALAASLSAELKVPRQTVKEDAAAFVAKLETEGLLIRGSN